MTLVEQFRAPRETVRVKEQGLRPASRWVTAGWMGLVVGSMVWLCGYLDAANAPLLDWYWAPLWVVQFFRNPGCEMGTVIGFTGAMLVSWPHLR